MQVVVNALVLRAVDYNEYDKILTLLTLERGKISAGIKGVKKAAAKLRFAAQPFCFAEYVLNVSGGRYTVTGASENESFYDLRSDVLKYYAAAAVIECANAQSEEGAECKTLFLETVKTLSSLCQGDGNAALITYFLTVLSLSGYAIDSSADLTDKKLCFDLENGVFSKNGVGASRTTYNVIRKAQGKPYIADLVTAEGEIRALKLIGEYFYKKTGTVLKSLAEYVKLYI